MNTDMLSLQDLSFNVIKEDFSNYASAYFTTNDERLKKNLHFLQKVYSKTLFSELDSSGKLEKQHLDFLLNEYLKILDIGVLLYLIDDKDEVIEKVSAIAHSLIELSCNKQFTNHCKDTLKALIPLSQNVIKISIPYLCDDELLKLITSSCLQLNKLDISESTSITTDGILALCLAEKKCPLQVLYLTDTSVTCENMALLLQNITTLEKVDYEELPEALYSIHKADILSDNWDNSVKYNLTHLNFSHYSENAFIDQLIKYCSQLCPRVKNLIVPVAKTEELELCGNFSELETLFIDNYKTHSIVNINNFLLRRGGKLKNLTINSCTVCISTLIAQCQNLDSLVLKNNQYQKLDEKVEKSLTRLKNLELDIVDFTDEYSVESVIRLLNSSPNLERLSLFHCDFMDTEVLRKLSAISLNGNLKHLCFVSSDIGIDFLHEIVFSCNSLRSLSLDNCENISSEEIDMLKLDIAASNKRIEVHFCDDPSELTCSDYDFDYDGDYDIFDAYDYDLDDYDCDDDDDYGYNDHAYW